MKKLDEQECEWVTFRPSGVEAIEAQMCIHTEDDTVGGSIRRQGRWQDCDALTGLWNKYHTPGGIYVEIGANIGACIMQMLLTTNATIVAFEPHPRNQFCLTSTLSKMDAVYRDRFSLFPIALGKEAANSTINAARGNMGNSTVGKQIKDTDSQTFFDPMPIHVERLDDVLTLAGAAEVSLMKLDAQGFECYIIDGMGAVLHRTQAIKAEVAYHWLSNFEGCSDAIMLDKLRSYDFDIFEGNRLDFLAGVPKKRGVFDIIALKHANRTS
jgi:FkbM family methyltransferase